MQPAEQKGRFHHADELDACLQSQTSQGRMLPVAEHEVIDCFTPANRPFDLLFFPCLVAPKGDRLLCPGGHWESEASLLQLSSWTYFDPISGVLSLGIRGRFCQVAHSSLHLFLLALRKSRAWGLCRPGSLVSDRTLKASDKNPLSEIH